MMPISSHINLISVISYQLDPVSYHIAYTIGSVVYIFYICCPQIKVTLDLSLSKAHVLFARALIIIPSSYFSLFPELSLWLFLLPYNPLSWLCFIILNDGLYAAYTLSKRRRTWNIIPSYNLFSAFPSCRLEDRFDDVLSRLLVDVHFWGASDGNFCGSLAFQTKLTKHSRLWSLSWSLLLVLSRHELTDSFFTVSLSLRLM